PSGVEQPGVVRVVDSGKDTAHTELAFGQQGQDEVVLVVSGGGEDQVGGVGAGALEDGRFAGVAMHQPVQVLGAEQVQPAPVLIDDGDLVAGGGEQMGGLLAEPARPGNEDVHVPKSLSRKERRRSSAVEATAKPISSSAWARVSPVGTKA